MKYHLIICVFVIRRQFFRSCYLCCIHSYKTALFRKKITVVCKMTTSCLESWILFHKADLWVCSFFAISQKSLKIFWYFGLCRFNDNLITVSKTFSFSSRNWNISVTGSYNIYSLGKEDNSFHVNSSSFSGVSQLISLAQPPNQRCRQNYALILLPLLVGYPLSLNHLLSTQLLTVCFLPFFEAYNQQLTSDFNILWWSYNRKIKLLRELQKLNSIWPIFF